MRGMTHVFINNIYRMISRIHYLFLSLGLTIAVMALAIFFTSQLEVEGRLAVVGEPGHLPASVHEYRLESLEQVPPKSQLVRNKYDAVLIDQGNGHYTVETIKGDEFKLKLQQALEHPGSPPPEEKRRGAAGQMLGFLTMIILMGGLLFMTFFPEDKRNGTFRRLAVSPVRIGSYMIAQCLFCFAIIYVPTYGLIIAAHLLLHIDIGLSLLSYGWLLGLLALLATAFAMFMTSWLEHNDNMLVLSGSLIVLTSLLSGSFYSFSPEGPMKWVTAVLPQKQFLTAVEGLEQHVPVVEWGGSVLYLLILSGGLLAAGWLICRRRLADGRY
ncbi:ABC transporter permease [Paenibacillus sp. J2TS4]|uniref:ABC transporter permease n=1 Tax=Paenibacillus sp. J2TS4 TaxID=2807194 RepID=UPI001B15BE08|nr:ABC transporter permease [Paenibacillus sp. J2TS4]GIP33193.1 permease [Paenibacillus sp. J2TS4]